MIYKIDQVNWPEAFPEKPEVVVEVNNDHERLFLKWHVKGEQLRAVTTEDQGPVWEDSCVEFFCQVPGEKHYCNFEVQLYRCDGRIETAEPHGRCTAIFERGDGAY